MIRALLSVVFLLCMFNARGQTLIPFLFTSEDENVFISENDSFKLYIATGDSSKIVCIDDDDFIYRLLNRERKTIAEGRFIYQADKFMQEGKWEAIYESGKIKVTGYYQRGLPVGTWVEYFSNGKIKSTSNYGLFEFEGEMFTGLSGSYQEYYKSGKMKSAGYYSAEIQTTHDTVTVTDPVTDNVTIARVPRHRLISKKAGHWEYYGENGELDKTEEL